MDVYEFKSQMLPLSREMFATAVALTHNVKTAEDLVQDALERLWTCRNELDSVDSLRAYSMATVRHIFIDSLRIRKIPTVVLSQDEYIHDVEADAEKLAIVGEEATTVYRLIDLLPEKQRTIITLRDIEGRKYSEIEQLTGMAQTAIRVNLSRARKAVRKQFKEYYRNERK